MGTQVISADFVKISDLDNTSSVKSDTIFPIVDDGTTKKTTLKNIADSLESTFATKDEIPEVPDVSNFATKDEIPEVPDVSNFATKDEIPEVPDVSNFATKDEVSELATLVDNKHREYDDKHFDYREQHAAFSGQMRNEIDELNNKMSTAIYENSDSESLIKLFKDKSIYGEPILNHLIYECTTLHDNDTYPYEGVVIASSGRIGPGTNDYGNLIFEIQPINDFVFKDDINRLKDVLGIQHNNNNVDIRNDDIWNGTKLYLFAHNVSFYHGDVSSSTPEFIDIDTFVTKNELSNELSDALMYDKSIRETDPTNYDDETWLIANKVINEYDDVAGEYEQRVEPTIINLRDLDYTDAIASVQGSINIVDSLVCSALKYEKSGSTNCYKFKLTDGEFISGEEFIPTLIDYLKTYFVEK